MKYQPPKCLYCKKPAVPPLYNAKGEKVLSFHFCEKCDLLWQNQLKNIMSTADGKDFINVFLRESAILNTHFAGNSADAFNAGKRVIGTWLLKECVRADAKLGQDVLFNYLQE